MIPITTLYDEYIDWPKMIEQKNPFEAMVSPPLNLVGTVTAAFSKSEGNFSTRVSYQQRDKFTGASS